jgi:putative transposase
LKGVTARQANKLLGRTGEAFWQAECYDRWIRNEEEFRRVWAYIENNPVKAGLVAEPTAFRWSSARMRLDESRRGGHE